MHTWVRGFAVAVVSSVLVAIGLVVPSVDAASDASVAVDVVSSTADGSTRVAAEQRVLVPGASDDAPVVDVRLDQPRQRLQGVGAALTESSAYLLAGMAPADRHAVLESLFDPAEGGLSVVRLVIGSSDFSLEHVSLVDSPVPDPDLTTFSIDRDRQWVIPVMQEILAINPDIAIIASPWSAPAWMKDPANILYGSLKPEYEDAYARYLVRYLEAYRDEGIPIDWLTVQNEPANIQLTYPTMIMSSEQQARLVHDDLGPALSAAALSTQVLLWDHNWCDAQLPGGCAGPAPPSFPFDVLDRVGATPPIAGTALHCYGGDQATANDALHEAWPDLRIWETECSGGEWQGSRVDAFTSTARLVLIDRNHWSNATILWNLALDPDHGPHLGGCDTCRGVVTIDPTSGTWTPELDRDVLATVSRFGGRGSGVLETTTDDDGLLASGVCSADGRPAAIVWNPGAATTATVRFGSLALPVDLAASSLTAVRAPEGIECTLAASADFPESPDQPSPTTPAVPPGGTDGLGAAASPTNPRFTG